ncbi:MAG: lipopolysaccharide biosynthesis protein [Prevotella sp.]|nr:lipopolysaccharide biosynthesis protein [Prevotella sp.]
MDQNLKKQTVHGVMWSAVQRFSTQGIQFVTTIIMARMLTPSDYGVVGMLDIFIAILSVFVDSGFINALTRKQDRTHTDICTVFFFNIGISLIAYCILFLIAPLVASFYSIPELCIILRLLGLIIIIDSFAAVQMTLMIINLNFKIQTKISIISLIISGAIGIILAYNNYTYWALVIQSLLYGIISTSLYWYYSTWRPSLIFSKQSFKEMFSFGSKILVTSLINTTYGNLYSLVIGKVFSANILGNYSRANAYANFPSSNLTSILQRVTYPVLCKLQDDKTLLSDAYRKLIRTSAFIIFPLMTGLSALSNPFIIIILGVKWSLCAVMLQIICFALMWYPIHALNLNLLLVKGRSDLLLRTEIIKKIIGIIVLCISVPLGIIALCYSGILTSIICLIINTYYTGKLINVGFNRQMLDISLTFIISISMWGLILFVNSFIDNILLQMIVGIIVGSSFYLIVSYLFNKKELINVLSLIRK